MASKAVVPLLGKHYHGRVGFGYQDLKIAFGQCQWVEANHAQDVAFGLRGYDDEKDGKNEALWYRSGVSPAPEFKMRGARPF